MLIKNHTKRLLMERYKKNQKHRLSVQLVVSSKQLWEPATFHSILTDKEAEILLIFLKEPTAWTVGKIRARAQVAIGSPNWYTVQKNLDNLESFKFIDKIDDARGTLYHINNKFLMDWKAERLRYKLRHIKLQHDEKKEIPLKEIYDEKTLKFFLL